MEHFSWLKSKKASQNTSRGRGSHSQMIFKLNALKDFGIFTREKPVLESRFHNIVGLQVDNFIKKRLQGRCFSVSIAKFLRAAFLWNTSGGFF